MMLVTIVLVKTFVMFVLLRISTCLHELLAVSAIEDTRPPSSGFYKRLDQYVAFVNSLVYSRYESTELCMPGDLFLVSNRSYRTTINLSIDLHTKLVT